MDLKIYDLLSVQLKDYLRPGGLAHFFAAPRRSSNDSLSTVVRVKLSYRYPFFLLFCLVYKVKNLWHL